MRVRWAWLVAIAGTLDPVAAASASTPGVAEPPPLDPLVFFDDVVRTYRSLVVYEDTTRVVETVSREGQRPHRVETAIACRLEHDTLTIETPGGQVRAGTGLGRGVGKSPAMESLVLRYNLWLAPHMALHFVEEPLADFRLGVPEPFAPTTAERVEADGQHLVRLVLRSPDPAAPGEVDELARFELWVDPETMLVRRIEGWQRLPDGADYRTSLRITTGGSTPGTLDPGTQGGSSSGD